MTSCSYHMGQKTFIEAGRNYYSIGQPDRV